MQRKAPLPGRIFARCIPKRLFAGLFGCMARISCQSQLISDAWRANLAANWRFSRPKPPRRCMRRKNCHGLPPGNAPRRNLATARHLGTHRARVLPLPVRPRAHQCAVLPLSDAGKRISRAFCHRRAQERTVAEYCHCQSPENAFVKILPWTNAWIRPAPNNCRPPRKKNGAEGRTWRTPPSEARKTEFWRGWDEQRGYGAVQRHRRTLGNAPRRNIAMADNAPRDKRRRAFCSPSFAVLFTARVAIGAFAVGSRRHLAVSLIETHIR